MSSPDAPQTVVARVGHDLAFLVGGLPVGVVAFSVAVVGFTVGASLAVVGIGVPVLVVTLAACRLLADRERRVVEQATGRPLPAHRYRLGPDGGPPRRRDVLRDPQRWRDLLHALLVALPVNLLTGVLALTCVVGGVAGLLYGTWQWALPANDVGLVGLVTGVRSRPAEIALNTVLGAGLLLAAPRVLTALVALRAAAARVLLTRPAAELAARAEQLAAGRRSAVRAEAQVLRRLERDLHDGPQQRLVRLTMDLEAAGRRLGGDRPDPQRAHGLVAEALTQSREALAELRALSRGIAPPVLADRGLEAALAAAAARSPVPVSLDVALPGPRPPAAVENAAYFVVAEALTNVAKHAQAGQCAVTVRTNGARLVVTVRDDGVGGAHPGKGHGLAGLADRVAALDGTLHVVSPPGGPTELCAELPLSGWDE